MTTFRVRLLLIAYETSSTIRHTRSRLAASLEKTAPEVSFRGCGRRFAVRRPARNRSPNLKCEVAPNTRRPENDAFSHPDYTVGSGFAPESTACAGSGLARTFSGPGSPPVRNWGSGLSSTNPSPCPEGRSVYSVGFCSQAITGARRRQEASARPAARREASSCLSSRALRPGARGGG